MGDPSSDASDAERALLTNLRELAAKVGVDVRIEPFELRMAGKGGLCRIGTRRVILVDAKLSPLEQAGIVGEALGKILSPETLVSLDVPKHLLVFLRTGHGPISRLLRPRPLARGRSG